MHCIIAYNGKFKELLIAVISSPCISCMWKSEYCGYATARELWIVPAYGTAGRNRTRIAKHAVYILIADPKYVMLADGRNK
jgi:hypothetical protein